MACLSGENGAGKSALLDAMTWAVWGKARVSRDQQLMALGESQMEVTFVFRLAGQEYRIFRRRSSRGATIEFETRSCGADEWTSISGDSVRQTETRIVSILKMDYDTFVNSAFLLQGKADSFTAKTPGERKKVLSEILNLADYDQLALLAREDERSQRARISQQRVHLAAIDSELARRPEVERELVQLVALITQQATDLETARTEQEQLAAIVSGFETLAAARASATERRDRDAGRIAELVKRLAGDQQTLQATEALLARAPEIEAGVAEWQCWQALAQRCAAILRERRPLEQQHADAQSAIVRLSHALQRQLDKATTDAQSLQRELDQMSARDEELMRLRAESTAAQPQLAELEEAVIEVRRCEQRRTELSSENLRLRQDMDQIALKLAQLAEGEGECPICRRPLAAGDHAHIEDEWRAEGKQLGDRFRANKGEIEKIEAGAKQLECRVAELETLRDSETRRVGHIQALERELAGRAEVAGSADAAEAEAKRLLAIQTEERFAQPERAALAAAETALAALHYDSTEHQQADARVAELAHFDEQRQQLDTARLRLETLTERISDAEHQRAELQTEIDQLNGAIAKFDAQLVGADEAQRRLAVLTAELRRLEKEFHGSQNEAGRLKQQLARLDQCVEERRQVSEQIAAVALDADALKELNTAFGRNGIQALIIDTVLPELTDEANDLLRRMSTSHMQVEMRTQRELQTRDATAETLDIIIRDEHGVRDYDLYSGGEAFRVNFAIRVALAKLLARRAGATIDMLVIDEGFGTQDSNGRDGLIEALQSVSDDFASILVITHINELRDLFPTRIEVVKTADGSRVSVN
jgi:exonuclease SbcC